MKAEEEDIKVDEKLDDFYAELELQQVNKSIAVAAGKKVFLISMPSSSCSKYKYTYVYTFVRVCVFVCLCVCVYVCVCVCRT